MAKWIAKINEGDSSFGDEIFMAIVGGETGFEVVFSNGDDSGVLPGYTEEETRQNLEEYYGYYDTFSWLELDES